MEVERAPRVPGSLKDRRNRGGVVTVLVEDFGSRFQEYPARADRPLLLYQLALPLTSPDGHSKDR